MTYKWDADAAEKYARDLSARIATENYVDTDVLDGDQLLTITPIRQANLLVIRSLYERWQEETRRLQSPYFDFTHPEVQYALDEFMNVLSQFIAVRQRDFELLLSDVIMDTLQLCLQPSDYYEKLLRNLPNFRLSAKWLENNRKYYVINRWVFDDLKEMVQETPAMYANEAIENAKQQLATKPHDSVEEIMTAFNDLLPLPEAFNPAAEVVVKPVENKPSRSFFDSIVEDRLSDRIKQARPVVSEPVNVEVPAIVSPQYVPEIMSEPVPVIKEAAIPEPLPELSTEEKKVEKVEVKRINENHVHVSSSLNDRATATVVQTDHHRLSKIDSIRKSVSLNQRFLFINNLFNSNVDEFNKALDEFDQLNSFDQAHELAMRTYVPKFLWNVKSAEVEEFFEILKRRF